MAQPRDTMSGFSVQRTQHLDYAENALDACLWLWPFLRPEALLDRVRRRSISVLESLSIAIFLGNAKGWVTLSRVSRRFLWISRQWCTSCDDFARGRARNFAHGCFDLEGELRIQSMCTDCEIEMFRRLAEQVDDPDV